MKIYRFQNPFATCLSSEIGEHSIEDFLSDEDYLKVAGLEVGEAHTDEDGFIWRRDA